MRAWDETMPIPHDGFEWVNVTPQPNRYGDQIHTISHNGGVVFVLAPWKERGHLIKHQAVMLRVLQSRDHLLQVLDGELEERFINEPEVELECRGRGWVIGA